MSDNLQKLYESTRRMNPNFTVPFDEFSKDMQDVGNRQRFYNNTRKNNPEFTVSFDEFSKDIGFGNSIDWGGPQFRPTSQPLPEKQKQAPVKVQAGGAGKPEIKDMMFPPLTGYDKPITMKSPTAPKTTVSIGNDAAEGLVQPFGKGKPLAVTAGEQVAGIQLPPDRKLNAQLMGWLDSQGKTIDDYKDTNAPDNLGGNPLAKAWLEANKVETGGAGSGYYGYGGMAVGNRKPERVNTPAQYAALQDFFTKSPTGRELSAKLEEKRKSLDDEVRALLPQTQKMQEEISRRGRQNIVSNPSSIPIIRPELDKQNAKDIIMQRAISFVNEAGKRISATKEGGGFLKGIGHDWGDALRLLAPGIDMVQDETINNLVDKYQKNPKSLTADEKFILNAKRLSDEVASYYDAGSWYNIGQSTKQSLPFMRDFIFTEGIGSGISNAVKSGIERTLTRSGVTGLASRIFNSATVNRAETVGKGIIDLTVQPTVQTALGPSSYGMTAQSMSGQGSTDAEGNMQFDNRDSLGSSLLGTWVQNHSELFGTVVLDKLFSKFKLLPKFLDTPRAQSIARVTGIASPLGEYGEEKESDAIDVLRGKQTAEEFFDPRRNAETFGAVAVMQVPFTAIQSAGYAVGKYGDKARAKAISGSVGEAEKSLDIFGNEKQGIISYIDNALNDENPMTLNASLASMMQRADLTDEQKQAVKDYAVARSAKQGIDDFAAGKPERKGADEILGNIVDPPIPEGVDPDDPDTHAGARVQLDEAARQAQALLSGEDLDILSEMSLIPADEQRASIQDMFRDKNLSDEQKQAVVNYLSMANQSRKLEEAHRSNVIGRLQQAENEITASVNPTTGTIVTARVQGMEQPVRIKEGLAVRVNPENAENPFETDVENSLETVSYYGEDGKVYPALAENLEVLSNDGVEQQLEALRQRFAAEEEAFQLAVNGPQPAVNFQQFQAGDKGMLPDGSVTAIQDVRPDGTYVVQVENRQTGEINVAEVPAGEIGNYGFGEVVDAPAEVQPSDEAQATPQPSTEVSEEKPVFPVNKEGEIDYGQISNPKMYLDALTLEFGEDVPEIVAEKRKEAVAELEQAGKEKDIIARKRAEKKAREQVAFWDNVEGLYSQEESQGLENNVVRENNSQTKSQDLQNDTQAELPDLNPTSENLPENTGLPDATQGNAVTGSSFSANPVIERYPRLVEPEKPLSEMTSEELLQLSDKNLRALKAQDRAFEGKTEAEKESGGYYGVLDDVSDLRDTAMQVNFVENSESLDELAGSAKSTLQEVRVTPNEYQQAVLSAVGRKAGEMGVSPQDLVRAMAEKVASQYPDLNDAEFMVRSMLGKILPENDSQTESQDLQNDTQAESQSNGTPEITGVGIDRQIEEQQPNTDPTKAQKAAGNYKKAHVQVNGMDISIENPVGSVRSGTDEDGKAWEHEMKSHYGYFTRTTGKDGDHIDVFVKEGTPEDWNGTVFVVDQVNPSTGEFDESKVMLGYETPEEAKAAYMENYDSDWQGFGAITPVDVDSFKKWLYDGARQRKAFAEYVGTPSPVSSDQLAVSSGEMPEGVEKIQPVGLGEQERLRTELQNSQDRNEATPELEKLVDRLKQTGLAKDVVMDEGKMREYLDRHFGGLLKPRMQVEKPKSPKKENGSATLKEKQLATVIKYNPAPNSYNTWIRDVSDILSAEEAFGVAFADGAMYPDFSTDDMRSALEKGEMTVYSSKPIRKGSFVTPSQMNAESYAGDGKIYSKVIKLTDVAWIDEGEGQYAPVRMMSTPAGEVYGFATADGTIYLDPNRMNPNTPIHEFGHLYWSAAMPAEMKRELTDLLKQTPGWKGLEQNPAYSNLKTDDQKADELFNTILGNYGESSQQVREIMGNDIGLLSRITTAINNFLEWLQAKVFGNTDAMLNVFARKTLGELLKGQEIASSQNQGNGVRSQVKDEAGVSPEMEAIKQKAIADGTFMKAPNGKDSNLNEKQWLQVRTEAFKKWFGDWEKDPENASKVVDKNREPIVVYHGTDEQFNEFKDVVTNRLITNFANGYGYFFTPSENVAEKYGENKMPVFLNIRNWKKIDKGKTFAFGKKFIGADRLLRKENRKDVEDAGFDGFYLPNISWAKEKYSTTEKIPQYVAFEPTQIKSATGNQGTFDGGNADIRMQAKKNWQQEESDKQFEKAKTVLDAFKKEGLDGFSISRSITDFGVSTYIQGPYNLKFRISDHSVISTHRILNESFFYYNTPVEFLVNEAKVAKEKYEKIYASREEAEKKYRKREQESADKWERIKSNFDGLVFKKNNRTYQNFDVFSKAGQNPRSNIYQKSLEGGAFYYEWTEPTDYDKWGNPFNFGEKKPSMEYIEAFDEGAGEINTTRFQIAPPSKPEYTPVKNLGDYAREVDEYNQNIRMQAVPPQESKDEQELRRLNNSLKYGVENKLSDLEQALANKEVSEASYRKQRDELELMAEKIRAKIKDAEKLRDMVKMREDYQAEMRRIKAMEIEKEGREKLTEEDMPYVNDAEELKRVQQIVSDVENLAGVENTEELAVDPKDLVAVVRSIKNKKKQQENLPKIKKAAQDITDYVRAYVGKDVVDMMSERDFKALINKLETATSTGSLKSAVKSVNQAIMRIILRKNNDILSGLIHGKIVNTYAIYELDSTLKANNDLTEGNKEKIDKDIFHLLSGINAYNRYFEIQGKNKRGVSVAKNVDEGTREIIQFVRDNRKVSREKLGEMKKEIELAQTSENYVFDEGDGRRLVAIDLLGKLQDLQDKDADIKAIQETSPADFNQENPDKWKWEAVLEGQKELEAMQMELITEFTNLIELGRSRITEWKAAETERKNEIAGEAIAAVKDKRIKTQAEEKNTSNWERVKDVVRHNGIKEFLLSPLGSFNFMLKYIDRNNVVGEGPMYNRFMRSPENSVTAAKEKYYTGWDSFKRESAAKAEEIFGKKFKDVVADSRKDSGVEVSYKLFDKNGENGELVPVMAAAQMTKGELMYLYMTWQQVEGREKLENMLVDETVMESVKQTLGEKYIRYADWVQQEFLPSRRVEYNDTHKRVFGTSMAEVKNYFPLKYDEKQHVEEVEIGQEVNYGLPSTMTGAIINRVKNKKDIALNANAFDLLMKNGQEMEEWSAYAQLRKDMNALLSNNYFKNLVEASDRTAFKKLKESAQIALRAVRQKAMPEETLAGNINRRLAGGAIAFRINTALKQFLGYPAFMSYSLDPMYQARVANNILPYMYYRNYVWAVENLPGFKERVSSGVFGNEKLLAGEWATSEQVKGKRKVLGKYGVQMDDFFNSLISVGMKPNQWVDAVAVSAGAKAVYDYKKGLYKKQGIDEREAHERAIFDASIAANETQQSAEDAYLSPIQKSDTLFARGLTTFMNASFGFLRKHVEGMMQVARSKKQYDNLVAQKTGSGMSEEKAKSEALKTVLDADGRAVLNILVFGFMLNTIWDLADKALWGTGDDDDEEQAEMYKSLALSPVKNMLLGSTIVSTLEGYEPKDLMGGEITRAYNELSKIAKDEGYLNSEMALATSKYFMKFYTGINFDVWNNIYNGYERGIKEKGGATMAYQYFTNVPQSVRIATAKKIRPGESIGDYAKRVSLAYEKESRFDREMKAVLTKYMFSDEEGKMTLFNKAYDKAREWEKIKKDEAKKNTGKWKELAGLDSDNSLTMLYKLVDNGMGQYKKAVKNGIDFSDGDKKTAMETYRKNVLALVEKINGKK